MALIVLAAALTYATSFTVPFLFDDFGNIVRNPHAGRDQALGLGRRRIHRRKACAD